METLRDVFNGTKNTEINYVQYSIYFPPQPTNAASIQALRDSKAAIDDLIAPLVTGHLWQKDAFTLRPVYNDLKDPKYPFLFGISRFGDCLHDEWFIIHLLYHISTHFEDAIISVQDNDGEVLLIETAMALPDWLDPSNSDNRVYIYQGQLHVIPLPTSPADIFTFMMNSQSTAAKHALKKQDALDMLRLGDRSNNIKTVANDDIQRILDIRLQQTSNTGHEIHHTRTILANAQASYVLLAAPQLLPLAVDAFYLRDPESLKACATMRRFPPCSSPVDVILEWTRTTYAQTLHQKFYAPKPFRHLPPKHHETYQAADLGMKLMCGLEMLYAKKEQQLDDKIQSDQMDVYDMLDMAPTSLDNGRTSRQLIDELVAQYTPERLALLLEKSSQRQQDPEDWMHVYPDELDALLSQKTNHGNDGVATSQGDEKEGAVNLEDMMAKFEQFLEHSSSGVEGVNLPGEKDGDYIGDDDVADDNSDDDVAGQHDDEEDVHKQISFDFTSFMDILNRGITGSTPTPTAPMNDQALNMETFMNEMDREIASHEKIGGSFVRNPTSVATKVEETIDDEEDEDAPVDVQLNLIQNVLESFKGQQGLPGPAGNLLRQFNIALPADKDEEDEDIE